MTRDLQQTANRAAFAWRLTMPGAFADVVDGWLWRQRESLFLWMPVALGLGIGLWFLLPGWQGWAGIIAGALGLALAGVLIRGRWSMIGQTVLVGGVAIGAGVALVWWKAERVAAPVLERPVIASFSAQVEARELLAARGQVRLLLRPDPGAMLPPRVRVTMRQEAAGAGEISAGDAIGLRARLVPPPRAALPGGYDFSRAAWFQGIGAVGSVIGPISRAPDVEARPGLRERLSGHITRQVEGSAGAIASALATGDQGGIAAKDAEAMRRAGLTHLLSISGLHVTAAVGGAMWLLMRLLALFPRVALRVPLLPIAAAGGALVGLGYTLLTGAQVPTIRSLVASLLVLTALLIGREAISMRLVAAGAIVVLLIAPQSLVGPSFQLSFAAVAAIVALHSSAWMQRAFARRDEAWPLRLLRSFGSLLLTGVAVEAALTPIAFYHFHRAGVYGALANIVAIPLTTLVVMPAEALALTLDGVGAGAPAWWVVQRALEAMLWMAHAVAEAPGSVATVPGVPLWAYGMVTGGGLWLCLWRGRSALAGLAPILAGAIAGLSSAPPDLIITGDGRHVATRLPDGRYALLRDRAGEFVREQLNEVAGIDAVMDGIGEQATARCSQDFCVWQVPSRERTYAIMASRSSYYTDWRPLVAACRRVDIVISDRRLPRACVPRWIKADRALLAQTGGLAIRFDPPAVRAVKAGQTGKPWEHPPTIMPERSEPKRPINDNDATVPRAFPES